MIGNTAPTDPLETFRAGIADLERRIADLERAAARTSLLGFLAHRSTNESAIANSATRDITFNTILQAKGGWQTVGAISANSFTVPPAGDGLYSFSAGVYWGVSVSVPVFIGVTVNNLNQVANDAYSSPTTDRMFIAGDFYCVAGDVVRLHVLNLSGASITPTTFAGDINTPKVPYLAMWRVGM